MEPYRSHKESLLELISFYQLCLHLPENPDLTGKAVTLAEKIASREALPESISPFPQLRQRLDLDGLAWFCAGLAVCASFDGPLRNHIQSLTGSPVPTFDLTGSLYAMLGQKVTPSQLLALMDNPSLWLALALEQAQPELPFLFAPLIPRKHTLYFTAGTEEAVIQMQGLVPLARQDFLPLHQPVFRLFHAAPPQSLLFLSGPAGSGKRALAARISHKPRFLLDLEAYAAANSSTQAALSHEWALEAVLSQDLACIGNYLPQREWELQDCIRILPSHIPLLVFSHLENCPPPRVENRDTFAQTLGTLSQEDFFLMGKALEKESGIPGDFPFYKLTAGQMREIWLESVLTGKIQNRQPQKEDFIQAIHRRAAFENAALDGIRLTDLVVSPATSQRLQMVVTLAKKRPEKDCNLRSAGIVPYGKGVSALFYGPSGTGKTMAAQAVANELGLSLWRVDLSQILDKYIGETEKHLSQVFTAASHQNTLLFFDEADALFGKRSEISSSHDRYANIETSFLLQQIEAYDGIVLLATNLYKNFDPAFLRRINIIIRFSMPDAALRKELWEKALPPDSFAEHIDLEWLAQELELSPASIRASAHMAFAFSSGKVSLDVLALAIQGELEKSGQELPSELLRIL